MFVWQRIIDVRNFWHGIQDGLAHLVHGVLHRWAVLLCESLHGDISSIVERLIELWNGRFDRIQPREFAPAPSAIDLGGENSVPDLWESCVRISDKAVELGASAFQNQKSDDSRADLDALASCNFGPDVACVVTVAGEGMCVWLSVEDHACPTLYDDLDVGCGDMRVGLDKVSSEYRGEELGRIDWVFFGFDVNGVLHGIGGHDNAVICFGIPVTVISWLKACWVVEYLTTRRSRPQGEL